jgi:hypothetical protein
MGFFSAMATSAGISAGRQLMGDDNSVDKLAASNTALEAARRAHEIEMVERNELNFIATMKMGENVSELQEAMNMLLSKAAQLPSGFAALGKSDVKQKKAAIIEKLDFGLMKLRSLDPGSVSFFEGKIDALKGKKK